MSMEFCAIMTILLTKALPATSSGTSTARLTSQTGPDTGNRVNDNQNEISNFSYQQSSHNTLALLRATEQHTSRRNLSNSSSNKTYETRGGPTKLTQTRKYKELVRHASHHKPASMLLSEKTFFYGINWQYDLLDEERSFESSWTRGVKCRIPIFWQGLKFDTTRSCVPRSFSFRSSHRLYCFILPKMKELISCWTWPE